MTTRASNDAWVRCGGARLRVKFLTPTHPAEAAPGQVGGGQAYRGWRQRLAGRRRDGSVPAVASERTPWSVPARWDQGPARQRGRRCHL